MRFHDYIRYRCINLNKVVQETGITYGKLRNAYCPDNLGEEDIALLKKRLGDWDKLDEEGNEKEA